MSYFERPEEVIEYLYDALSESNLGLEFTGYLDERLLPKYPALVLGDAAVTRELHSTNTFMVMFTCNLFIYHAKLTERRRTRTLDDLKLVTKVVQFLQNDAECRLNRENDPGLIFSFTTSENPGVIARRGDAIVGTRIAWSGESRVRFR